MAACPTWQNYIPLRVCMHGSIYTRLYVCQCFEDELNIFITTLSYCDDDRSSDQRNSNEASEKNQNRDRFGCFTSPRRVASVTSSVPPPLQAPAGPPAQARGILRTNRTKEQASVIQGSHIVLCSWLAARAKGCLEVRPGTACGRGR